MDTYDNTKEEIELRSEDYHYILGKTPSWILQWGISLILCIFSLMFVASFFIKYPDTISTSFVLSGTIPPARVKAKSSGQLTYLYVSDNQNTKKGDYLAIIENPAITNDVIYIKSFLDYFLKFDTTHLILPSRDLQLGIMQASYLTFYQTIHGYIEFKQNNYHGKRIRVLKERIVRNMEKYNNLLEQQSIINEQFILKEKQYKRDSILHLKEIISNEDFENANINYLDARLHLLTTNTNLDNIQISMTEMTESLIETENDYIEKENYYKIQIRNYALQLYSEIQSWEMNFVLVSPIDGKISFNNYWAENQNIIVGEDVFNIIPSDNGQPFAKALLPITRSGKVKKNQKVNLHFENFPDNEYGVLKGTVSNISLLPSVTENTFTYTVKIELPNGLVTSYKKILPYYPEMRGHAEIISDELSLMQRILFPMKKIFTERFN